MTSYRQIEANRRNAQKRSVLVPTSRMAGSVMPVQNERVRLMQQTMTQLRKLLVQLRFMFAGKGDAAVMTKA
jgi:hypothetical protein